MIPGDYVICNDIIGCIQTLNPLTLLCQDGKVREIQMTPTIIMTGQQVALMTAERLKRRLQS